MSYNWQQLTTEAPAIEVSNLDAGVYEFEVVAVNALGEVSNTSTIRQTIAPQQKVPSSPTNVSISPIDEFTGLLSWDRSTDIQVVVGGKVLIYHQPVLTGASWDASTEIIRDVSGSQASAIVPLLEGTYLVKFSTNANVRSNSFGTATIKLSEPDPVLTVSTITEDTSNFPGNESGLIYDAIKDGLVLKLGDLFDSFALDGEFDDLPNIDYVGGVNSYGEYYFSSVVDLGAVCDVQLIRRLAVEPYNVATLFDNNAGEIDTWGDFDCIDVTDANATLYVRSTDLDPSSADIDSFTTNIDSWTDFDYGFATWGEWRICTNNFLRGRGFQFKAVVTSAQESQNIVVKELGVTAKLRQRIERSSADITSGASTYTVNFVNNFHAAPAIMITPVQTYTGDYYTITSVTSSGFQVSFFDSAASAVSRVFNYTAVGYGRRF